MKKTLLCFLMILTLVLPIGCGTKVELDLSKIKENLNEVYTEQFATGEITQIIEDSNYFKNLIDIFNINDKFEVKQEDVSYVLIKEDEDTKELYAVVKPVEGKLNSVKKILEDYIPEVENVKVDVEEHQGYLIMAVTEGKNTEVLSKIKSSKMKLYNNLSEVTLDNVSTTIELEEKWVEKFLMMAPQMITSSSQYIIVKPSKKYEKEVKDAVNEYLNKLEKQWEMYLPDQYRLVKDRLEEKEGDYLIYIISIDNELALKQIRNSKIK